MGAVFWAGALWDGLDEGGCEPRPWSRRARLDPSSSTVGPQVSPVTAASWPTLAQATLVVAMEMQGAGTVDWGGACPLQGPGLTCLAAFLSLSVYRPRCLCLQRCSQNPDLLLGGSGEDGTVHIHCSRHWSHIWPHLLH